MSASGTGRTFWPLRFFLLSASPVLKEQVRHILTLSHIVRHQHGTGGDDMPGDRRVAETDWPPGRCQRVLDLRGCVYRGALSEKDCIRTSAEDIDAGESRIWLQKR